MRDELHNCIYLTAAEFVLLAGSAGLAEIDSIFREPLTDIPDEALRRALADLCSRGLLRVEDEPQSLQGVPGQSLASSGPYFQADPEISQIFRVIRGAVLTAIFFAPGEETPDCLAYVGEETAVLQVSRTDKNAVRIFTMDLAGFSGWLQEEGLLQTGADPAKVLEQLKAAAGVGSDPENTAGEWLDAAWMADEKKHAAVPCLLVRTAADGDILMWTVDRMQNGGDYR